MDDPSDAGLGPEPVLCDLDGVVWLAQQPIRGSVEAIAELRRRGHRVLFVTNNSSALVGTQEVALAEIGVPARGDVVTSAQAAALVLQPGTTALVAGGPGVVEALGARGVRAWRTADEPPPDVSCPDAVVVGLHRDFDYDGLSRAATAVRNGAQLIGTNDDPTYPTPAGPIPGGGAILAAVATASGCEPLIAGKPHQPMADLVRAMLGARGAARAVMVGDRPDTDGRFARTLGCRFALVWSGLTRPGATHDPMPDLVADDLAGVVAQFPGPRLGHG